MKVIVWYKLLFDSFCPGFPGVIGLIDCMHTYIEDPLWSMAPEQYVNCYSRMCINNQIIIDHNDRISNLVSKWPDKNIKTCF